MTKDLPPRLLGTAKGSLEVRIDVLKSAMTQESNSVEIAKFIKLQWWGQTQDESAKLAIEPNSAKITYNVLTRPDHFQAYLRDAGRLYLETLSHSGHTLGFAVIERLERIVQQGGITADDVEVFNKQGKVIAVLRCMFMFEEFIEEEYEDLEQFCPANSKKVTFSKVPSAENIDHDYDEVVSQTIDDDHDDVDDNETAALKRLLKKSNDRLNVDLQISKGKCKTVSTYIGM